MVCVSILEREIHPRGDRVIMYYLTFYIGVALGFLIGVVVVTIAASRVMDRSIRRGWLRHRNQDFLITEIRDRFE